MLKCENLSREFKIYKKEPGLKASLKSFFSRKYIINKAVQDFTLDINTPQFLGLLGPNGSGKTTLMKIFTGIITPSSGTVQVLGENPIDRKNSFKKNISLVMGQKSQLLWDIPVMDSFLLFQKYYEIKENLFQKRVKDLGERLNTTSLLHVPVRKLSLGERMKMELMACLLHDPKVIFLDEPTIGLDIVAQKKVRQFLKDYYEEKKPLIILTSHYMADVEALCENIVLIINGKKHFSGSAKEFKKGFEKQKTIMFSFSSPITAENQNKLQVSCFSEWSTDGLQLKVRLPEIQMKEVMMSILNNYPVSDFYTEKVSIEEIMGKIFSKSELLQKSQQS